MKTKEISGMDKNALNEKILELKKELIKINAQVAIGTALKNPGQVRKIKKTIARMLTINNQKNKKVGGTEKSKILKHKKISKRFFVPKKLQSNFLGNP